MWLDSSGLEKAQVGCMEASQVFDVLWLHLTPLISRAPCIGDFEKDLDDFCAPFL